MRVLRSVLPDLLLAAALLGLTLATLVEGRRAPSAPAQSMTIRVLVVDDQPLIRSGLAALFTAAS